MQAIIIPEKSKIQVSRFWREPFVSQVRFAQSLLRPRKLSHVHGYEDADFMRRLNRILTSRAMFDAAGQVSRAYVLKVDHEFMDPGARVLAAGGFGVLPSSLGALDGLIEV